MLSPNFCWTIAFVKRTAQQVATKPIANIGILIFFTSLSLPYISIITYFLLFVNSFFQKFWKSFVFGIFTSAKFYRTSWHIVPERVISSPLTINIILQLREKHNRQNAQRFGVKFVEIADWFFKNWSSAVNIMGNHWLFLYFVG